MSVTGRELAERLGTPLYVYDLQRTAAAHRDLVAALPQPSRLYYSLKANPHPDVVAFLSRLGCGAEVSSVSELRAAMDACISAGDCLYTGPAKSFEELYEAVRAGVALFSAESPVDLNRIANSAHRATTPVRCLLRVNPDSMARGAGLTMTGRSSPFGADASWVLSDTEAFRGTDQAPVVGTHIFQATNAEGIERLLGWFKIALATACLLRDEADLDLQVLDLGGGFGVPFARSGERPGLGGLREALEPELDRAAPGWRVGNPAIVFESGRYLVAGAGTLYCRVMDVKRSKGRSWVILDSGINHLGGMWGLRRIPPIGVELALGNADEEYVDVAGPLCTPLDSWGRDVRVKAVKPGEIVAVPNVGAYGLTASLVAFLGRTIAAEAVVDGDQVVSVTRMELVRGRLEESDGE